MTLFAPFPSSDHEPLSCVDMHTMGMPTRIVVDGYPELSGTLLEQKAQAMGEYDHIRTRLLQEPRGHYDMFGAVLRPETEHTASGAAHMGVLYLNGEGYSNMCGHATIGVCRLLVDVHDTKLFPKRNKLQYDDRTKSVRLVLHTPGGLVESNIPTIDDGARSDPSRPVSFVAIPAFALATDLKVDIPESFRWPELDSRSSVVVSMASVSAISCHIQLQELGFPPDSLEGVAYLQSLDFATKQLKAALNDSAEVRSYLQLPGQQELGCVFGVQIEDGGHGAAVEGTDGAEVGLYFFGNQHIDRSPTGSLTAARNAIKFAKGQLGIGQSWTYHSILTNKCTAECGFVAKNLKEVGIPHVYREGVVTKGIVVEISGSAFYTGFNTYVVEKEDPISKEGFLLNQLQL